MQETPTPGDVNNSKAAKQTFVASSLLSMSLREPEEGEVELSFPVLKSWASSNSTTIRAAQRTPKREQTACTRIEKRRIETGPDLTAFLRAYTQEPKAYTTRTSTNLHLHIDVRSRDSGLFPSADPKEANSAAPATGSNLQP